MEIKSISACDFILKAGKHQAQTPTVLNIGTKQNSQPTDYNNAVISFGLARINLDMLKRINEQEIKDRFLKPDEKGNTPGFEKNGFNLKVFCKAAYDIEPKLIEEIFTAKNGPYKKLIAHDSNAGILEAMHEYCKKLPDGDKILKIIYTTEDSQGCYPAHYFDTPEQLKSMIDVVDTKTLKQILTHQDKIRDYSPMHYYENKEHMMDAVLSLIDFNSKENIDNAMSDIFLPKDRSDEGKTVRQYNNLKTLLDTFKNDTDFLDKFLNTGHFQQIYIKNYDISHTSLIHKSLKEKSPDALYKLYKSLSPEIFPYDNEKSRNLANYIADLVIDSDLSEEKSLSLLVSAEKNLKKYLNPEYAKEYSSPHYYDSKDIDLSKEELKKALEKEKKLKGIDGNVFFNGVEVLR